MGNVSSTIQMFNKWNKTRLPNAVIVAADDVAAQLSSVSLWLIGK